MVDKYSNKRGIKMDDMFIASAMMTMDTHSQMMWQQKADTDFLITNNKGYSYVDNETGNVISNNKYDSIYFSSEPNYSGNDFNCCSKAQAIFDDREIRDTITDEIACYIKVENINTDTVLIKTEIKKGYMYEEDIESLIKKQIYAALRNGYVNIQAAVGKNDEVAGRILENLGFENT